MSLIRVTGLHSLSEGHPTDAWMRTRTGGGCAVCVHSSVVALFISSADFANAFVAGGEEDDGDEGEGEGESPGDPPLTEDDAQIFGGPRKEHLRQSVSTRPAQYLMVRDLRSWNSAPRPYPCLRVPFSWFS